MTTVLKKEVLIASPRSRMNWEKKYQKPWKLKIGLTGLSEGRALQKAILNAAGLKTGSQVNGVGFTDGLDIKQDCKTTDGLRWY